MADFGVAPMLPPGKRGCVLRLGNLDVAKLILPGDHIDILATFTVSTLVDESDGNFAAGDDQLPDSAQTAAAIDGFPNTVQWAIHPQGAFLTIFDNIIERPLGPNLLWIFALEMNRYMQTYGLDKRDIATVAVNTAGQPAPSISLELAVPLEVVDPQEAARRRAAAESDELRQAMGSKRSRARMERLKQRLFDGMAERGITGRARWPFWPGSRRHLMNATLPGNYRIRIQLSGMQPPGGRTPHLSIWHQQSKRSIFDQDILAAEEKPTLVEFEAALSPGAFERTAAISASAPSIGRSSTLVITTPPGRPAVRAPVRPCRFQHWRFPY